MSVRAHVFVLLTAASWLWLSGCSTTRATADATLLGIKPVTIDWVGLASRWTGPEVYRVQIVTFHDLKESELYHARYDIELTHQGLTLVAQTPLGVLLYELEVSGGKMIVKTYVDQLRVFPAEQTLADFVLTYWPLDQLMEAASAAGYSVLQADTIRRLLNSKAEIVVEVIRQSEGGDAVTRVIHYDVPLQIDIRTASGGQVHQ